MCIFKSLLAKKVVQRKTDDTLQPAIKQLKGHVCPAWICKCKEILYYNTQTCFITTQTETAVVMLLVLLWSLFAAVMLRCSISLIPLMERWGLRVITDWIWSCCKICSCTGISSGGKNLSFPWLQLCIDCCYYCTSNYLLATPCFALFQSWLTSYNEIIKYSTDSPLEHNTSLALLC